MPQSEVKLHEAPLPTTVGGSQIGDPQRPGSRVTGPPSQKYPILRDLVASPSQVTLEVDTETRRVSGILKSIAERPGSDKSLLYLKTGRGLTSVALKEIIAFRVLKVEAEMGENGLVL